MNTQAVANWMLLSICVSQSKVNPPVFSNFSWTSSSPQCRLTQIRKYHFSFCCQHQITYFISRPVKQRKATCRISFASTVQPYLPQRQARLPTDSFNYGYVSDRITVDSLHKPKGRGGFEAASYLEFYGHRVRGQCHYFFCQLVTFSSSTRNEDLGKYCLFSSVIKM